MLTRIISRISDWMLSAGVRTRSRFERLSDRIADPEGAMTIEYILIIALIAVIIITLFTILLWPALRPVIEGLLQRITDAINGDAIT